MSCSVIDGLALRHSVVSLLNKPIEPKHRGIDVVTARLRQINISRLSAQLGTSLIIGYSDVETWVTWPAVEHQ